MLRRAVGSKRDVAAEQRFVVIGVRHQVQIGQSDEKSDIGGKGRV